MRSSFAKSIYVGAAVLGLAGLSAVTTTTASAKSYATAGAYTALANKSQNVTVTGTNAIYSKPGTVKGAKVVASKKTVAKLAASKKSSDTFYAYGTKTTNRGSVYYKIVTMDKKYRGYVYAGKTAGTFTAGIKAAETTTAATTPARTTGYYLKDASKNTLWTAPKNTDIHAKKVSLYGVAKTDSFTVDKAATKTKEGSLYYHVTDSKNSAISGWIYAGKGYDTTITDNTKQDLGGLSVIPSKDAVVPTNDNSVKVVYRDANNATVGNATFVTSASKTKAGQQVAAGTDASGDTLAKFVTDSAPSGYVPTNSVDSTNSINNARYGSTVYVDVTAAATSKIALKIEAVTPSKVKVVNGLAAGDTLTTSDVTVSGFKASLLTGKKGGDVDIQAVQAALAGAKLKGNKTYYSNDGTAYHYEFKLTATGISNIYANYGDTLSAYYTATLKENKATNNSTPDNSWIA
ncbi:S-layer protein [Levilactobacillus brevis]|uniref:S-layer protein n=1 Tax=Levilactobacillus brevis TaxID=1580 RepID=UPI001C026D60|nr:S-layer protein [Levilactobacillus brevis]MBT9676778.1 S-layer protein [Levilactobacillus brevis]